MNRPSPWRSRFAWRTYLSGLSWALGLVLAWRFPAPAEQGWLAIRLDPGAVAWTLAALIAGANFFGAAWRALRSLRLDMAFLMSIAIVAAILIGEPFEAASLAFLFSTAELLEHYAVDRARRSVSALVALSPEEAEQIQPDGTTSRVRADQLRAGDRIRVRPGDRIGADGRVESGISEVNEAAITGETAPVPKVPGSATYSGTLNIAGTLDIAVTADAAHSVVARIAQLVRAAEGRRAPVEQVVQRFAAIYTPLVTLAALVVAAIVPLAIDGDRLEWFVRGVTLLVIACPCALVIATPVSIVSALTSAARYGVLVKGGEHLERLAGVQALATDKTGTLTSGEFDVERIDVEPAAETREATRLIAAAESRSQHPIAHAIVRYARSLGIGDADLTNFQSTPGKGIEALVDGRTVRIGTEAFAGQAALWSSTDRTAVEVYASIDGGTAVRVVLRDQIRPEAAEFVTRLRKLGIGPIVLLTGDQEGPASHVAQTLELDQARFRLLPEEKVEAIRRLRSEHGQVAMIGDGVNDAPALAEASVGIAMGVAGTPTAIETADVALMGDDLTRVPYAIRLARRTQRVVRFNIAAALLLKAVLAVGAIGGQVNLAVAVLVGDLGGALLVTLNAMRLARVKP